MSQTKSTQEQQPVSMVWIVLLLVGGYLILSGQIDLTAILGGKPRPKPTPEVVPDDSVPVPETEGRAAPAADLLPAATAVRERLQGSAVKAAALEGYYAGLADVLAADTSGRVATMEQFRSSHRAGLQIRIAGTSLGDSPAVGDLVDAVFAKAIGDLPGPMDAAKRAEAVRAARAVAWACWAARGGG